MDEDLDFELNRFQRSKWEQLKSATRLALEYRKRVDAGDLSAFLMPLAFAIAKDALFDFIPVVGLLFGFFITVYLFIFLWGRGKWKVRLTVFFLSFFDLIPVVNFIPFQTLCVAYAYYVARQDAERSKEELKKIDKAVPQIADTLRGVERQRALAAESREAMEQAEAAAVLQTAESASANASPRERAGRVPQMARSMGQEPVSTVRMAGFSGKGTRTEAQGLRLVPSRRLDSRQRAANDASYGQTGPAANDAVMRIREAGSRLSQASARADAGRRA